jgi:hypothetical protein
MGYRRRLVCACVRTTLTDGTIDRIEGFATEGDAGALDCKRIQSVASRATSKERGRQVSGITSKH